MYKYIPKLAGPSIVVITIIFPGLLFSAESARAGFQLGCDNETCEEIVCGLNEFNEFCCTDGWDPECQADALEFCSICNGCPSGRGAPKWRAGSAAECEFFMNPITGFDDVGNCNDKNEDGLLCFRLPQGLQPIDSPHPMGFTWHDNNPKKIEESNCCP